MSAATLAPVAGGPLVGPELRAIVLDILAVFLDSYSTDYTPSTTNFEGAFPR